MEDTDLLIGHIKLSAVNSLPETFMKEFHIRARRAYDECYQEVASDKTVLSEQRLAKLKDIRYYRMERELSEAARVHNLTCTAKALPENKHHFVYVVSGAFGLTQSYVTKMGEMPQPAKFRENLANAARIPMLPLDDTAEIYKSCQFYGLLAHNPIGKDFSEKKQKLGTIQLCIPYPHMNRWVCELELNELLSLYPVDKKQSVASRAPTWKIQPVKKEEGEL